MSAGELIVSRCAVRSRSERPLLREAGLDPLGDPGLDLDPAEFTRREKFLTGTMYGSEDPAVALPILLGLLLFSQGMAPTLVSREPGAMRSRLRHQMEIYSYQFKAALTTFQKDAVALSGKVGGMKDDICICLQIGILFTAPGSSLAA